MKVYLWKMRDLRERYISTGHPSIYDELCHCGCYRSQHNDRFDLGYGSCTLCECKQFTWKGFLVLEGHTDLLDHPRYEQTGPPDIKYRPLPDELTHQPEKVK